MLLCGNGQQREKTKRCTEFIWKESRGNAKEKCCDEESITVEDEF